MLTKTLMINTCHIIEAYYFLDVDMDPVSIPDILSYNTNLLLVQYIAKQLAGDTEFSS